MTRALVVMVVAALAPQLAGAGTVEGVVSWVGAPSKPLARGDAGCAPAPVAFARDGGVPGALVWVLDPPQVAGAPSDAGRVFELEGCAGPRLAIARVGESVRLEASKSEPRSVSAVADGGATVLFSVVVPKGAPAVERRWSRAGLWHVEIAERPKATRTIAVSAGPWAVLTDAEGRYALPSLPEGTYVLEAFHPSLGSTRSSVRVPGDGGVDPGLRLGRKGR